MNPNDNNLPYNVKYEETTSDLHPANKYKPSSDAKLIIDSMKACGLKGEDFKLHVKPSPCQKHDEGAESEEELELPEKCIKQEDYSTCPNTNVCLQCKID